MSTASDKQATFLTPRQVAVVIIFAVGIITLLSAAFINPFVGAITKGDRFIDYADTLRGYSIVSLAIGSTFLALSIRMARGPSWADNITLLALIVSGVVLSDRFLLTRFGLPLWIHDPELHYKHRPLVARSLAQFGRPKDRIVINAWGFHDNPIELLKRSNEYRIVALGDSITMGYGVTYEETYSANLERLWNKTHGATSTLEVINTGVHGYSTRQQRLTLERAMKFDPDLVILGFCMNDVTEPFLVDRELGGTGLDYHGIRQSTSTIAGWVANETGYGRLVQALAAQNTTLAIEKLSEVQNVHSLARSERGSPKHRAGWDMVLDEIEGIAKLTRKNGIPLILVVFPYDFQLFDSDMQRPQAVLAEMASQLQITFLDLTQPLADEVFSDREVLNLLRLKSSDSAELMSWYMSRLTDFYVDDNHFTPAGHRFIAERIFSEVEPVLSGANSVAPGMTGDDS